MRPEEVQNIWQEGGCLMREVEEHFTAKMSYAHGQQPESQNEPSVGAADDGIIDCQPEFLKWIRRTFHHPSLLAQTSHSLPSEFSRLELEILVFRLQKQLAVQDQQMKLTSGTLYTLIHATHDLTNDCGLVLASASTTTPP